MWVSGINVWTRQARDLTLCRFSRTLFHRRSKKKKKERKKERRKETKTKQNSNNKNSATSRLGSIKETHNKQPSWNAYLRHYICSQSCPCDNTQANRQEKCWLNKYDLIPPKNQQQQHLFRHRHDLEIWSQSVVNLNGIDDFAKVERYPWNCRLFFSKTQHILPIPEMRQLSPLNTLQSQEKHAGHAKIVNRCNYRINFELDLLGTYRARSYSL